MGVVLQIFFGLNNTKRKGQPGSNVFPSNFFWHFWIQQTKLHETDGKFGDGRAKWVTLMEVDCYLKGHSGSFCLKNFTVKPW